MLSICVHEFGHAIIADKLGDRLPRSQGRTTLNPLAHADPIGTFAFPLISLVITHGASLGFGWGKPVMVNPAAFTRSLATRTSHMLVAAAGPMMNVLLAIVITIVHLLCTKYQWIATWNPYEAMPAVHQAFIYAAMLNFGLALFNCIPTHPLDGGTILEGLLPERYVKVFQEYSVYGPFLLMAIIMVPQLRSALGNAAYSMYFHWVDLIGLTSYLHLRVP